MVSTAEPVRDADVIILGGGSAGLACAQASAELGARVILVDGGDWRDGQAFRGVLPQAVLDDLLARPTLGGTDLFRRFQAERDARIQVEVEKLEENLRTSGVRRARGRARVLGIAPHVTVATPDGPLTADRLVLAVGARVGRPAWAGPGTPLTTVDELYLLDEPLPEDLLIVGGSYVAVGAALRFRTLGAKVAMVFAETEPLAGLDQELARYVGATLARRGIRLRPETQVTACTAGAHRHAVETTAGVLGADVVVIADGGAMRANTAALDLDRFAIAQTRRGEVQVDTRYACRAANVFAVGDCADHAGQGLDPWSYDLGPVAEAEGRDLARHLFGTPPPPLDYDLVPLAAAGPLPIGALGLASDRAAALGLDVRTETMADAEAGRFAKLVVDDRTERVVGCHLAGPDADTVIGEVARILAEAPARRQLVGSLRPAGTAATALVDDLVALARALG